MFSYHYDGILRLKAFAIDVDLEKYYDIYEISRIDMEEAEAVASGNYLEVDDADTLQALKSGMQKLHLIRKIFLCTLLALDANGSKSDFHTWSAAIETIGSLSLGIARISSDIDNILREEEG